VEIAGPLAETNADFDKMDALRGIVGDEVIADALRRVAQWSRFRADHEIDNSTKRISDLVGAIKRLLLHGPSAMQEVICKRLEKHAEDFWSLDQERHYGAAREFAPDVPRVCATGRTEPGVDQPDPTMTDG